MTQAVTRLKGWRERGADILILAICCVDQIPLYGDLYVGHPPPTPPVTDTNQEGEKIGTV